MRLARSGGAAAVGFALAVLTAAGCSNSPTSGQASLILAANPRAIDDQGGVTQVTVNAQDAKGDAGVGVVSISAGAGDLASGSGTAAQLTLDTTGSATTTFSCDVRKDTKCSGKVKLTGTWAGNTSNVLTVTIVSSSQDGGGGGDGGGGMDAGADAGSGTGFGNGTVLTLNSTSPIVILGVGDSATLTAHLTSDAGTPLSGQPIAFATDNGQLGPVGGAPSGTNYTSNTDSSGNALAELSPGNLPVTKNALAVVSATHAASNATTSIGVGFVAVRQISWISTKCGGKDCTIMGLRGTGFNEQAQVTFEVIDVANNPVSHVPVTFSITNPPAGTTVTGGGITDSQGQVTANVSSGGVVGVFSILAVVIPGQIQTQSPSIGVVGVIPTNATFGFQCEQVNIPAYIGLQLPRPFQVKCHVGLTDRFGNPIGTGTSVFFKPEAGILPNSVPTNAFDPMMASNPAQGMGDVTFQTGPGGVFPAVDVAPLPALTAVQQPYPGPRAAEPSVTTSNGVVHNPRDGLVTLLAYVKGEEWFLDVNNNGVYDLGEPFVDQGEPCVDANDNNICDPDEFFVDVNHNGVWDGPNGVWDGDTDVWTVAYVLYTDGPVGPYNCPADPYCGDLQVLPNPYSASCPGGVPHGGFVPLTIIAPDQNLNRPWSGTTFSATNSVPAGTLVSSGVACGSSFGPCSNVATLDGYGFGFERRLLDAAPATLGQECILGQTKICQWQTVFTGWEVGNLHAQIFVLGQSVTPYKSCGDVAVQVSVTADSASSVITGTTGSLQ